MKLKQKAFLSDISNLILKVLNNFFKKNAKNLVGNFRMKNASTDEYNLTYVLYYK